MTGERTLPGLGLTGFYDLGSDGWKSGVDGNWLKLSTVAHGSVKSRTTSLPGTPTLGDIYIVPSGDANGDAVAVWDGPAASEAWTYYTPSLGWAFFVQDTGKNFQWTGAAWEEFAGAGGGGGITAIGLSRPDWEIIKEIDAAALTAVDLSTFDPSLYSEYEISAPNLDLSADALLVIQVMVAGVLQNTAGDYQYTFHGSNAGSTEFAGGTLSGAGIIWPTLGGTAANELMGFWVRAGPMDNGSHKHLIASAFGDDTTGNDNHFEVSGKFKASTSDVNGFRVTTTTGVPTITGKFTLRGRRKKEAFSVLTNAGAARGARLLLSANENTTSGAWVALTNLTETGGFDTDDFHDNSTNPGRIIIGSGIDKVSLAAQVAFTTGTGGTLRGVRLTKNGMLFDGYPLEVRPVVNSTVINIASGELSVAPGDYFELEVLHDAGGSFGAVAAADNATWFSIKVVEPTPSGESIAVVQTTDGALTSILEVPLVTDSAVVVTGTLTSWDATNKTIESAEIFATFKNSAGASSLVDHDINQHPSVSPQFAITVDADDVADVGRIRVQRTSGVGTFDHQFHYRAKQRV